MKILVETHHPAHIHFWKHVIRELQDHGHEVLMISRDRDVMRRLLQVYDWIHAEIPNRRIRNNRIPLTEMLERQWAVARAIDRFKPDVVASLMGSYTQSARLFGIRNVIFTDSEFQHFNHRIAHPFADEIHTPECFYKKLGRKQIRYKGIHELAFLHPDRFQPDPEVLGRYPGLNPESYVLIRLSAWNTFHDLGHKGVGSRLLEFIETARERYTIVISAEENQVPESLRADVRGIAPEDFHQLQAHAAFILSEGASTAAEGACLGIPTVYINSTEPRGYLQMLENDHGLVRSFQDVESGLAAAKDWIQKIDESHLAGLGAKKDKMLACHIDVTAHVMKVLLDG